MNDTDVPESVRDALYSRLITGSSPVSGSALGSLVYAHWPGMNKLDLRSRFGSLWNLLTTAFGDNVRLVGPQGGDTLYAWKGRSATDLPQRAKSSPSDKTSWRVFTNPTLPGVLGFSGGHLKLLPQGSWGTGFTVLKRMNQEDNLAIIRQFIEKHVGAADKDKFAKCLVENDSFWALFSSALETATTDYRRAWSIFRKDAIKALFHTRCLNAGQPESEIEMLWGELHSENRPEEVQGANNSPPDEFRELLKLAINAMTDRELAVVQIPVGVWARLKVADR